jgi:hypothetical protein
MENNFSEFEENMMQIASAQYIQLCRIYDFISVIADKVGGNAVELSQLHAEGRTLSPAPYLTEEE